MKFNKTFDEQFYLTLYKDVHESRTNPKSHYEIYGKIENRIPSMQKIINILGAQSFIELDLDLESHQIQILRIPWLPKRKEWGYLIFQINTKFESEPVFSHNVNPRENTSDLIAAKKFIKVMKIKRYILNKSSVGTKNLIFINAGFNES